MIKNFDEVFEDVTKRGTKIKTDEYRLSGKHQIIDQGQEQVAGYTDLEDGVFENIPAIIYQPLYLEIIRVLSNILINHFFSVQMVLKSCEVGFKMQIIVIYIMHSSM